LLLHDESWLIRRGTTDTIEVEEDYALRAQGVPERGRELLNKADDKLMLSGDRYMVRALRKEFFADDKTVDVLLQIVRPTRFVNLIHFSEKSIAKL
jgi:hypothetical protein